MNKTARVNPKRISNLYYVYYISRSDFNRILQTQQLPNLFYEPYLIAEPLQSYDAYSFRCAMLEARSNPFMEDLSNEPYDRIFDSSNQKWNYVRASSLGSRDYYSDFIDKKAGVFTFNGATFYTILDIRKMPGDNVEFHLKQITNLAFTEPNTAFMIMPFNNSLNDFYKVHVREFLKKEFDMNVVRADDFTDNDVIVDTIYREIEKAELIICEITECNKNVFYEIGYAKGMNKKIIFLAQKNHELKFFDVAHVRRIEYELDKPVEFAAQLKDTIRTVKGKQLQN